jgi:hypothetical protein
MSDALPPLEACGFVRVPGAAELWMKCEGCAKSDHFWIDGVVRCRCGKAYDHAVRPDGTRVPVAELVFVPFDKGPVALRDLELDPVRVGVFAVVVLALVGAGVWYFVM